MKYHTLQSDPLRKTQAQLAARVANRFPSSGLSELAAELRATVEAATVRASHIRRPNWPLRATVALIALSALGLGLWLSWASSAPKEAPAVEAAAPPSGPARPAKQGYLFGDW